MNMMHYSISESNLALITVLFVLLLLALMIDPTPSQTTIESTTTHVSDSLLGRWISSPKGIAISSVNQTGGTISAPASRISDLISTVVLEGISFKSNSNELDDSSYLMLNAVAKKMKRMPHDKQFEIAGHTDVVGSKDDNTKLSTKRAESVMMYLITQGVEAERLSAVGYGDSLPIADNTTDAGREANRRVELHIH